MSDFELRVTGTAWGPRCECREHPRPHYHGSAFLIQEAADTSYERVCNGCEADRKASESA